MELQLSTFLIVCPLVFFAGLVDAIAGGGGLISLPAFVIAGLPAHEAVATNKLSSTCGTSITTARFLRRGLVDMRLAGLTAVTAVAGSAIGARLSLLVDERILRLLLLFILPVTAFVVLNRSLFGEGGEMLRLTRKTVIASLLSALLVGAYDGFYGPGTGTFLIIAFTVFAKLSVEKANAQAKVINLTTNVTALAIYLANGKVIIPLGLAAAACNMAGNYIGSGLVLKRGARIVRPIMVIVLILLLIRVLTELF